LKILLVTPEYPPDIGGGILRYCRDLASGLRAEGCHVDVLKGSAFTHGAAPYSADGVAVTSLESVRYAKWLSQFRHFELFPELRRHLAAAFALHEQANEGQDYDAVEVTDWGMLFLPWVLSARSRVLVQLHGSSGQISAREPVSGREVEGATTLLLERSALSKAPVLCTYSRSNAAWWQSMLDANVEYLPPPLTPPADSGAPAALGDHWLAVGRIQLWKGPQVACEAWRALGADAPLLHWIGRDTRHGETGLSTDAWLTRDYADTWRRCVTPLGGFPPAEVYQRMLCARAIVVPSLWDTFNLVATEGMALGKVVVVSDGAGVAGLIECGVNGFTFPKGDSSALAKVVRQVDEMSESQREEIGQRAAHTARYLLEPPTHARAKLNLLRDLPVRREIGELQWMNDVLFPSTRYGEMAFLDALPLKGIAKYSLQRLRNKILRKGT
jgi:glycosyltransferase involved in cell wall biosynthesis